MQFLETVTPKTIGRLTGFNALSGLAIVEDSMYLIADNREELLQIPVEKINFETKIPGKAIEKKAKPDLESLFFDEPHARLLAVPSGSTPNRRTGKAFALDGTLQDAIDFTLLFERLTATGIDTTDFNVEGSALIAPYRYVLLNRGNGPGGRNGFWMVEAENFPHSIRSVAWHGVALPTLAGVSLHWTDCKVKNGVLYFAAAAEDTQSVYDDGATVGAALGAFDLKSKTVLWIAPLSVAHKIEGIELLREKNGNLIFRCCSDPDSNTLPGLVLEIEVRV